MCVLLTDVGSEVCNADGVAMSEGSAAVEAAAARDAGGVLAPAAAATTPWLRSASTARTGEIGPAAVDSPFLS